MAITPQFRTGNALKSRSGGLYLAFAVFLFIVIYWFINPALFYLAYQPFFAFDSAYFDYHQQFRLGSLSILSQFILQFLAYPFWGSLLLVSLLILYAFVNRSLFRKTPGTVLEGYEFIAPLLLLASWKNYTNGLESLFLLLLPSLLLLAATSLKERLLLFLAFITLSMILLVSTLGLAAGYVFGSLIVLWEIPRIKLKRSIPVVVLLLMLLFFFSFRVAGTHPIESMLKQFSFFDSTLAFPNFWLILLVLCLGSLLSLIPESKFPFRYTGPKKFLQLVFSFPVLLALLLVVGFKFLYVNQYKYRAEIDYLLAQKKWDECLQLAPRLNKEDRTARFQLNRALFQAGKMSGDLFSVPQNYGGYGLFMNTAYSTEQPGYSAELYYELGYVKAAKYWMLEQQTCTPYAPRVLSLMAQSTLALGEYNTSEKYFTVLRNSPVYKQKVNDKLKQLKENPEKLQRESAPRNLAILQTDDIINIREPNLDLINTLKESRQNKMAFEYLMAYNILKLKLEQFFKYVPLVRASGYYIKMPKTYEEVLLVYYLQTNRPSESWEFPVSKATIDRYREFKRLYDAGELNWMKLKEDLKGRFGNTFWYYLYFDNPDIKANQLKIVKP